jgi:hypothetical protein
MSNITLFAQMVSILPRDLFQKKVAKHKSDFASKGFDSWTHLISMLFLQIAKCESLRDIANGLRSSAGNLNHLYVSRAPSKSSISYGNTHRDWKLFQDFYFALFDHFEGVFMGKRPAKLRIKNKLYTIDSTLVSLCLEVFDWAKYRQAKGAIKIHTVLDYDGLLPVFAVVTDGKKHDVIAARGISFPSGSVLLMDRAYLDYRLLFDLDSKGVFFVTRTKTSTAYMVTKSREIPPNVKNITADLTVKLSGQQAAQKYGKPLRVVRFDDPETGKTLEFITNNFVWAASTIAMLYKQRWMIEIFFKQLKQHLKIKSFVGISENAVMIQIWTAMIAILLLKYLKIRSKYAWHMSNLVASIRINLLVKIGLWNWLNDPFAAKVEEGPPDVQYSLF